jgi:hypothetical protein
LKIIVCGDSAGGNLTCATTIRAIQENIPLPIGIMLHYPAVNLTNSGSLSRMIFSNDPILNYDTMMVVLGCYLGKFTRISGVRFYFSIIMMIMMCMVMVMVMVMMIMMMMMIMMVMMCMMTIMMNICSRYL